LLSSLDILLPEEFQMSQVTKMFCKFMYSDIKELVLLEYNCSQ